MHPISLSHSFAGWLNVCERALRRNISNASENHFHNIHIVMHLAWISIAFGHQLSNKNVVLSFCYIPFESGATAWCDVHVTYMCIYYVSSQLCTSWPVHTRPCVEHLYIIISEFCFVSLYNLLYCFVRCCAIAEKLNNKRICLFIFD